MGNRFREAIEIRPRHDRGLLVFGFILAAGVSLSLRLADIPPCWQAIAALAALGSAFAWIRRRVSSRGSHYVARAVLLADDRWTIFGGSGAPVSARLCAAWGVALGPVLALEWRCTDGRRRQAWLLQWDLSPTVWRRLRVRLRLT